MRLLLLSLVLLLIILPASARAGFGLILPAADMVSQGEASALALQLRLYEPREQRFAELARPKRFVMQLLGEDSDLLPGLKPAREQQPTAWTAEVAVKRPGDHLFHAESSPSWDAVEEQFIVHLVTLCVNALGLEEGWDEPVGAEAEIVPLSRPYGLWTGNLFSGQVLVNGEPAPYAAVEIAFLGPAPATAPPPAIPAGPYRVQSVRADAGGIFHYAMPQAGWWGFAATVEAERTLKRDGVERPVSLVTSYWVQTRNLP